MSSTVSTLIACGQISALLHESTQASTQEGKGGLLFICSSERAHKLDLINNWKLKFSVS